MRKTGRRFLVPCMGKVWSLTPKAYDQLLEACAAGKGFDLDEYGKLVHGELVDRVTDLGREDAKRLRRILKVEQDVEAEIAAQDARAEAPWAHRR